MSPVEDEGAMMATIRASCADCGDVELTTNDVRVRICTHDRRGTYSFRCPKCHMVMVKPAESRTIDLLVASGVQMATWDLPAELLEQRGGPVITHDDLLDFHHLLYDDALFTAAVSSLQDAA
jgi:hypothetical protein